MLMEVGVSLVKTGFRKVIFLNHHGGNEYAMNQTAQNLANHYPIWTAAAAYWHIAKAALDAVGAGADGPFPGHAGVFETSLIMAIAPDLVKSEEIKNQHPALSWLAGLPPRTFLGRQGCLTGIDGYTDAAHQADAEKGRVYLDMITDEVSKWLVRVCAEMENEVRE